MHVKYQLNWDNRFVKTVNTKKNGMHKFATCNSNFEKCISLPPIFRQNLRSIGLLVIVQPNTKVISTSDGQTARRTNGRTEVADDYCCNTEGIGNFFEKGKKI